MPKLTFDSTIDLEAYRKRIQNLIDEYPTLEDGITELRDGIIGTLTLSERFENIEDYADDFIASRLSLDGDWVFSNGEPPESMRRPEAVELCFKNQAQTLFDSISNKLNESPDDCYLLNIQAKFYMRGLGVESNIYEAFNNYTRSANQGSANGQYRIATLDRVGELGHFTQEQQTNLLLQSAAQRHPEALFTIGESYRNGTGSLEQDHIKAAAFLSLSDIHGSSSGKRLLNIYNYADDGWSDLMTYACLGNKDEVRNIIENGANIEECTIRGTTTNALLAAIHFGNEDTVSEIISSNETIQSENITIEEVYCEITENMKTLSDHFTELSKKIIKISVGAYVNNENDSEQDVTFNDEDLKTLSNPNSLKYKMCALSLKQEIQEKLTQNYFISDTTQEGGIKSLNDIALRSLSQKLMNDTKTLLEPSSTIKNTSAELVDYEFLGEFCVIS